MMTSSAASRSNRTSAGVQVTREQKAETGSATEAIARRKHMWLVLYKLRLNPMKLRQMRSTQKEPWTSVRVAEWSTKMPVWHFVMKVLQLCGPLDMSIRKHTVGSLCRQFILKKSLKYLIQFVAHNSKNSEQFWQELRDTKIKGPIHVATPRTW